MNKHVQASAYSSALETFLRGPHMPFINGDFVAAGSKATFEVDDPATGKKIADVPDCTADDVDKAVKAARAALNGPWSQMRPVDREKLMLDLANAIENDSEFLAELESVEQGKA